MISFFPETVGVTMTKMMETIRNTLIMQWKIILIRKKDRCNQYPEFSQ